MCEQKSYVSGVYFHNKFLFLFIKYRIFSGLSFIVISFFSGVQYFRKTSNIVKSYSAYMPEINLTFDSISYKFRIQLSPDQNGRATGGSFMAIFRFFSALPSSIFLLLRVYDIADVFRCWLGISAVFWAIKRLHPRFGFLHTFESQIRTMLQGIKGKWWNEFPNYLGKSGLWKRDECHRDRTMQTLTLNQIFSTYFRAFFAYCQTSIFGFLT